MYTSKFCFCLYSVSVRVWQFSQRQSFQGKLSNMQCKRFHIATTSKDSQRSKRIIRVGSIRILETKFVCYVSAWIYFVFQLRRGRGPTDFPTHSSSVLVSLYCSFPRGSQSLATKPSRSVNFSGWAELVVTSVASVNVSYYYDFHTCLLP